MGVLGSLSVIFAYFCSHYTIQICPVVTPSPKTQNVDLNHDLVLVTQKREKQHSHFEARDVMEHLYLLSSQ